MPEAIYTAANCTPAYQLRWSLALFAITELPPAEAWIEPLQSAVEQDGVRILGHRSWRPPVWQFLISTKPYVAPPQIVKSVKGRLQHILQASHPKAFRRNFSVTSVGDARREVAEAYVAIQLGHHRMADDDVQRRLERFQLQFPEVNLASPVFSLHGRYVYNLHVALVHESRWCEVEEDRLAVARDMLLKVARKKGHRLSRVSLFADHVHLTLGGELRGSPGELALAYLNNLVYAHGMQSLFRFGYYVGTLGNTIWERSGASLSDQPCAPPTQGRRGREGDALRHSIHSLFHRRGVGGGYQNHPLYLAP